MELLLIQFNIAWENKDKNLISLSRQFEYLLPHNSIIVLPEMFATGFSMNTALLAETMTGNTVKWMLSQAQKYNSLVAGSVIISENNACYNRFIWAFPDGSTKHYNKRHLFRMGDEGTAFENGLERVIIEWNGLRILPLICYDLRFPVWSRNQNDYDIIAYSANWPGVRIEAWQTLLKARAIENQAYVVGVNRVGTDGNNIEYGGLSMLVNFKGEITEVADSAKEQFLSHKIDLAPLYEFREKFPVWKDADRFIVI